MKNTSLKISLIVLILVVSNIITGAVVFQVKQKGYDSLKNSIQSTITQKVKVQNELEAYKLACPDVIVED
jgi:hypothetical protein